MVEITGYIEHSEIVGSVETRAVELVAEVDEFGPPGETPYIKNGNWWIGNIDTGVQARGADGVSPEVSVETITGGHRITITDAEGTHTADVLDGEDGEPGEDGVSPSVAIVSITGGHRITITDAEGTHTADVLDGLPGAEGTSPIVSITSISGGHRITIVDVSGTHTADVLDGPQGAPGQPGTDGDDGVSVVGSEINQQGHLIVTLSDGTTIDAGNAKGQPGADGDPGVIVSSTEPTDPNAKVWVDSDGEPDTYSKEEVDGLLEGKADVDDVPTAVSELENDAGYLTIDDLPVWDGGLTDVN